jgi:hypothetical protein
VLVFDLISAFKFCFKGALSALERVEKLEKELAYIDEKLSNIEIQQQELEHANIETEYLKSVKYAASALKQAQW